MSLFKVGIKAINPKKEDLQSLAIDTLVDTGSELTWLPKDLLLSIGITPRRKRSFYTATKQLLYRDVGYAILKVDEFETTDEVVFAEPNDMTLVGVRTIEGFGVMVDNLAHRLFATATLA